MEIKNLMLDQSSSMVTDPEVRARTLRSILPAVVRGIPESYTDLLLEQVPLESAHRSFIQAVFDWVDRLTPNSSKFPNLEFQKAYLLELTSKLNESEELLNELVKNHPTFVDGLVPDWSATDTANGIQSRLGHASKVLGNSAWPLRIDVRASTTCQCR